MHDAPDNNRLASWLNAAKTEPLTLLCRNWDKVPAKQQEVVFNKAIESMDAASASRALTSLARRICAAREPASYMVAGLKTLVERNPEGAVYAAVDYAPYPIAQALLDYAYSKVDSDRKNDPVLKQSYNNSLAEIDGQKFSGSFTARTATIDYAGLLTSSAIRL